MISHHKIYLNYNLSICSIPSDSIICNQVSLLDEYSISKLVSMFRCLLTQRAQKSDFHENLFLKQGKIIYKMITLNNTICMLIKTDQRGFNGEQCR